MEEEFRVRLCAEAEEEQEGRGEDLACGRRRRGCRR